MSRRIIDIYWDLVNKTLRDSAGNSIGPDLQPRIRYREKPLARVRIVTDGSNTAYTGLSAAYSYTAAIDQDFNHSTGLMCKTVNANINVAGDWAGGGTADPTAGQLSIRLDANTARYGVVVDTGEEATGTGLDIQALDVPGGDLIFAVDIPFRCFNIRDDAGATPPAPPGDYYTAAEIDAKLAAKLSCEYFTDDGQRKARLLTDTTGETYETLKLPE